MGLRIARSRHMSVPIHRVQFVTMTEGRGRGDGDAFWLSRPHPGITADPIGCAEGFHPG